MNYKPKLGAIVLVSGLNRAFYYQILENPSIEWLAVANW
jgi:hypothetical protein